MAFKQLPDCSFVLDQSQYIKQKLQEFRKYFGQGGVSTPLPLDYTRLLVSAASENEDKQNTNDEDDTVDEKEFPYRQIVGSLMYAMLGTRPDLAAAVSLASKYLSNPKRAHIKLVQHILKYLNVNTNYQLHLSTAL